MEIHTPHAPIHAFKDFLVQLGTITAGVLIALSLEGLVEWNHYRVLVREARETLASEIADNKRELDEILLESDVYKENVESALRFADELLTARRTDVRQITLTFSGANLTAASWESARATGALGHMDYSEVQAYSRIYSIQELYSTQERRLIDRVGAAVGMLGNDPPASPARDLELFRQQLLAMRADLLVHEQIGRQLSAVYQEVLSE